MLAAGYGTRLRPLTDELPKPLLPVLGRSVLARTLAALAAAEVESVAINLHHRAEAIPQALGERWAGLPLVYSPEQPILGTGGALVPLRDFFAGCAAVLVVNGDSLCRWPLRELLAQHRRSGAAATLLLAGRPHPERFGGGIGVDRRGRVTSIRGDRTCGEVARRHVFAGAHVLRPDLLARLPAGPSDSMADLYLPLLAAGGHLDSLLTWRPWHDLGTPRRYLEAVLDTARREAGGGWRSPAADVASTARLRRSVVEAEARVAEGARLERSLVLAGATVGHGCALREVVVAGGTVLPPGSRLAGVLVTPGGGGLSAEPAPPRAEGAVAGGAEQEAREVGVPPLPGLVLTPL